jgi:hypothetical protein
MIKLKLVDRRNQEFEFAEGEHFIGRGPYLEINDPKCSKRQAKLVISEKKILLQSIGKNPMSVYSPQIGWRKIAKDQQTVLHPGDTINLLLNYYPYKILVENTEKKDKEERFIPDYNDSSQEASIIVEEVFSTDQDPPPKNNSSNPTNGHKNSSNNNNNNTKHKVDIQDQSIDLNQSFEPDSPQIANEEPIPPPLFQTLNNNDKKTKERDFEEKVKKEDELKKEMDIKQRQDEINLKNLERKKEEERKQAQNSPKKPFSIRHSLFDQKNNTLSNDGDLPPVKSSMFSLSDKLSLTTPPTSPKKASAVTPSKNNGNTSTSVVGQKRARESDTFDTQSTPTKKPKTVISHVVSVFDLEDNSSPAVPDTAKLDVSKERQKQIEKDIYERKKREEEDAKLALKLFEKEKEAEERRKDEQFIASDDDFEEEFGKNKNNNKNKKSRSDTPKQSKRRVIKDESSSISEVEDEISFDEQHGSDDFYKRNKKSAKNASTTTTTKQAKPTTTVTKKSKPSRDEESNSGSADIGKSPKKSTSPNKANSPSKAKPTTRSNKKTAKPHSLKYDVDSDDFQSKAE